MRIINEKNQQNQLPADVAAFVPGCELVESWTLSEIVRIGLLTLVKPATVLINAGKVTTLTRQVDTGIRGAEAIAEIGLIYDNE